eukprot:s748_g2.t2
MNASFMGCGGLSTRYGWRRFGGLALQHHICQRRHTALEECVHNSESCPLGVVVGHILMLLSHPASYAFDLRLLDSHEEVWRYSGWPLFALLRALRPQLQRLRRGQGGAVAEDFALRLRKAQETRNRADQTGSLSRRDVEYLSGVSLCGILESHGMLARTGCPLTQAHQALEAAELAAADAATTTLSREQLGETGRNVKSALGAVQIAEDFCPAKDLPEQGLLSAEAKYIQHFHEILQGTTSKQTPSTPSILANATSKEAWVTFLWAGESDRARKAAILNSEVIRTMAHSVRKWEGTEALRAFLVLTVGEVPEMVASELLGLRSDGLQVRPIGAAHAELGNWFKDRGLQPSFAQLAAFTLTEYTRVVVLDADVLMLQPCHELFRLPLILAAAPETHRDQEEIFGHGRTYLLNAAVACTNLFVWVGDGFEALVVRPNLFTFERIKEAVQQPAFRSLADKIGVLGQATFQSLMDAYLTTENFWRLGAVLWDSQGNFEGVRGRIHCFLPIDYNFCVDFPHVMFASMDYEKKMSQQEGAEEGNVNTSGTASLRLMRRALEWYRQKGWFRGTPKIVHFPGHLRKPWQRFLDILGSERQDPHLPRPPPGCPEVGCPWPAAPGMKPGGLSIRPCVAAAERPVESVAESCAEERSELAVRDKKTCGGELAQDMDLSKEDEEEEEEEDDDDDDDDDGGQYMGVSNALCGLILALRTIGDGLGNTVGGTLGDLAHLQRPNSGRIYVAMWSVLASVPLSYIIFVGAQPSANSQVFFAGILFLTGLISSWEVSGCLNPVLIDIVPRRQLASAFAWNVAIVFTSGNMIGPMFVGMTAQHLFNYKLNDEGIENMPTEVRLHNAQALGKSLCITSTIPCAISAIIFSMLFFTYPKDKAREQEDASSDSEIPELAKVLKGLLERALRANELKILQFLLEEVRGILITEHPLLHTPEREGHFDHDAAWKHHFRLLLLNLCPEEGYDQHRVEQLLKTCCCALGLVEEALYQEATTSTPSRATNMESTSYGNGHPNPSTGFSLQDSMGHSGHSSKLMTFQPEYSHFDLPRGPETLGGGPEIQPRDVRAPVRKRINRLTVKMISKPELILIGCTKGKSLKEAVSDFENSGLGPHYIIAKDGQRVSFVDEALCAWWGNPACWRLVDPVYTFEGVGEHTEVHNYAVSISLEGDGEANKSFTEAQYTELMKLIVELKERHSIKAWNILGLAEVSMPPGRFSSPGSAFHWARIRDVTFNVDAGEMFATGDVCELMQEWGYGLGLQDMDFQNRLQIFRCRYGLPRDTDHGKDVAHLKALLDARSAEM